MSISVYFYGCATLDGYLADKTHGLDWLHQTGTAEDTGYEGFYRQMDVTIMGRRTFREVESLGSPESVYPTTRNYVFTHDSTFLHAGFTPVRGAVPDFVAELGRDQNIWVIGGGTVLAPLLDCGMVDHIILQIAPVLLGGGVPLFTQKETLRRFHLERVQQYGQFAELTYAKL